MLQVERCRLGVVEHAHQPVRHAPEGEALGAHALGKLLRAAHGPGVVALALAVEHQRDGHEDRALGHAVEPEVRLEAVVLHDLASEVRGVAHVRAAQRQDRVNPEETHAIPIEVELIGHRRALAEVRTGHALAARHADEPRVHPAPVEDLLEVEAGLLEHLILDGVLAGHHVGVEEDQGVHVRAQHLLHDLALGGVLGVRPAVERAEPVPVVDAPLLLCLGHGLGAEQEVLLARRELLALHEEPVEALHLGVGAHDVAHLQLAQGVHEGRQLGVARDLVDVRGEDRRRLGHEERHARDHAEVRLREDAVHVGAVPPLEQVRAARSAEPGVAGLHHLAIRQHDLHAGRVVEAIRVGAEAPAAIQGVADARGVRARARGSHEVLRAVLLEDVLQLVERDAGLHRDSPHLHVVVEDPVHAAEVHHHAVALRRHLRPVAPVHPAADGVDVDAVLGGDAKALRHLDGGRGPDDRRD